MGCSHSTSVEIEDQLPPQPRGSSTPKASHLRRLHSSDTSSPSQELVQFENDNGGGSRRNDSVSNLQPHPSNTLHLSPKMPDVRWQLHQLRMRLSPSMTNMNVDCGCLIFQYLTITEAITLSRTERFWYEISRRRTAYHPMKFPSFGNEFDILEYRNWQEYGRQRYALTLTQLIQCSKSRVVQHGLHDLELIFVGSTSRCCDRFPSGRNRPGSILVESNLAIEEVVEAISRIHLIQALTIHLELVPPTTRCLTFDHHPLMQPMTPFQEQILNHLFKQVSSTLISFQLSIPHDVYFHQRMMQPPRHAWSWEFVPVLSKLRHLVFHGCERWLRREKGSLETFLPRGGVVEFIRGSEKDEECLSNFEQQRPSILPEIVYQIQNSPLAPQHLLFKDDTFLGCSRSDDVYTFRSDGRLLPYIPINPFYGRVPGLWIENVTELLPADGPLPEFTHLIRVRSPHLAGDLAGLLCIGRSFMIRILSLKSDGLGWMMIQHLHETISKLAAQDKDQSSQPHDCPTPFVHVINLRLHSPPDRLKASYPPTSILTKIQELFPSLESLELHGSIHLPHQLEGCMKPLARLRHLTTPLPDLKQITGENHLFFKRILIELRSLESLHIIVDQRKFHSTLKGLEYIDLLIFSSVKLKRFTLSHYPGASVNGCFTNHWDGLVTLNQFLITLHHIWEMIQPTHIIPLDHINLTPTCMTDLVPLFSDFLPDPSRLPYLRHRCQLFDASHPMFQVEIGRNGLSNEKSIESPLKVDSE